VPGRLGLVIMGNPAGFAAQQLPEWQDPAVVQRNQEDTHVPIVPYAHLEQALADRRLDSPFFQLLNGSWKFHWAPTPQDAPRDFFLRLLRSLAMAAGMPA